MRIGRSAVVEAVDEVVGGVLSPSPSSGVGAGAAAGVPDGGALQEHLLAVAEGLAALGAARARRVEVVVVAGLEHLPRYEPADMTGCEPGVNCRNMI